MYLLEEVKKNIAENVTGKIKAVHTMDKHVYRLPDGSLVDSVTQRNIIDKPHLIPWAVRLAIEFLEKDDRFIQLKGPTRDDLVKIAQFVHRDTRDDAGTVGGQAHQILEDWENEWISTGMHPGDIRRFLEKTEDARVWAAARSGAAVFDKYPVVPVAAELLVGVAKEGAGTLDLLVLNEAGELELWDHKTSNQVDPFYAMQTSAYRHFFQKMTGLYIARIRVLKLDKGSDRFHVYNVPFPNRSYAAFRHLSKVYDWQQGDWDKLVEDKRRVVLK